MFEFDQLQSSETATDVMNFLSESLKSDKSSLADSVRTNIAEGADELFLSFDMESDDCMIMYSITFDCNGSLMAETIRSRDDLCHHGNPLNELFDDHFETIVKEFDRCTALNVLFNNRNLMSDKIPCFKRSLDALACFLNL